jgi:DNA-binding protein
MAKKKRDSPTCLYQVRHLVSFPTKQIKEVTLPCRGTDANHAVQVAEQVLQKKYPNAEIKFISAKFPNHQHHRQT